MKSRPRSCVRCGATILWQRNARTILCDRCKKLRREFRQRLHYERSKASVKRHDDRVDALLEALYQ